MAVYSRFVLAALLLIPPIPTLADINLAKFSSAPSECFSEEVEMIYASINWSEIASLEMLDSCLLAAFHQIANLERFLDWLRANGFDVVEPFAVSEAVMQTGYGIDGEGIRFSATIQRADLNLDLGFLEMLGVSSLSVGITLDGNRQPVVFRSTLNRI